MVVMRLSGSILVMLLLICLLKAAASSNSTTEYSPIINGKNNFLVRYGEKCRSDWVITNGPTDPNCYKIFKSNRGYNFCCPTKHKYHKDNPFGRISNWNGNGCFDGTRNSSRNGNSNSNSNVTNNSNGNTHTVPICRQGYRGSRPSRPDNQCYKLCHGNNNYTHCCAIDSSRQIIGEISNLTLLFALFQSSNVGNETITDATLGVCRQQYHLSSQSDDTCCYEHQTGGGHRYCCPSQVKAFEENCLPTIIKTTRCPSDWARSFKFYDSRCYLSKISGHGEDYCCPVSSRPAKLCWRVGYILSNTPYSVRCYQYNYRYCCPLSGQWLG